MHTLPPTYSYLHPHVLHPAHVHPFLASSCSHSSSCSFSPSAHHISPSFHRPLHELTFLLLLPLFHLLSATSVLAYLILSLFLSLPPCLSSSPPFLILLYLLSLCPLFSPLIATLLFLSFAPVPCMHQYMSVKGVLPPAALPPTSAAVVTMASGRRTCGKSGYKHVCVCECVCSCLCSRVHVHMLCTCSCAHVRVHMFVWTWAHMSACVCIHVCKASMQ